MDIQILPSIHKVEAPAWDALTDGSPFQRHAFFVALEDNGCLGPESGWVPRYLCFYERDALVGCMSAFVKTHSMGEFVYDFGWARSAQSYGIPYYPKLVIGAPFSPVAGQRVHARTDAHRRAMLEALPRIAKKLGCAGTHILFPRLDEASIAPEYGAFVRHAFQFQWHNEDYTTFDDYLAKLRSRRRKEVRRERRSVASQGIEVRALDGASVPQSYVRKIFELYLATVRQYSWGQAYLTEGFFRQVLETMPEHVVFFGAYRDGELVAGAFCLRDETTLYGRYWGSFVDAPHLHFETSLYAPMEWAIKQGIRCIEPGAGGEHKFSRGFLPTKTYSAHWHGHEGFHAALDDFCQREARAVDAHIAHLLKEETPFHRQPSGEGADSE